MQMIFIISIVCLILAIVILIFNIAFLIGCMKSGVSQKRTFVLPIILLIAGVAFLIIGNMIPKTTIYSITEPETYAETFVSKQRLQEYTAKLDKKHVKYKSVTSKKRLLDLIPFGAYLTIVGASDTVILLLLKKKEQAEVN